MPLATIPSCNTKKTYLITNCIPIEYRNKDRGDVSSCVGAVELSEGKLILLELPLIRFVFGAVNIMRGNRYVGMATVRGPSVESERDVALDTLRYSQYFVL
jgi:hypothetical protein